jgi:chemotaxis signal transduction protein
METSSNAWLLECAPELIVAVSDHEIVEYIQPQRSYTVPQTPPYCNRVIAWQDKLLPVIDMALLTGVRNLQQELSFACLLRYQTAPRAALQYLALRISRTPQKVVVDDSQVCEFSDDEVSPLLKSVTLCCFTHLQQAVPILDLGKLCSGEFRELAQDSQGLSRQGLLVEELVQADSGHAEQ